MEAQSWANQMEVENSLADLVTRNLLESHVGSTPSLGTLKENVTIHAEMNPIIFSAAISYSTDALANSNL